MPTHDLRCTGACGEERGSVWVPLINGEYIPPTCCARPMEIVWRSAPGVSAYGGAAHTMGQQITVEDGRGGWKVESVGSISDRRRIERESEQRARDGVGRPYVFRAYANDRTNRDTHALAPPPQQRPDRHTHRGQPVVTVKRGRAVTATHGTVDE